MTTQYQNFWGKTVELKLLKDVFSAFRIPEFAKNIP